MRTPISSTPSSVYRWSTKPLTTWMAFKRLFGFQPNTKLAVLIFGLFHGFGLATKLQELDLARNGLVTTFLASTPVVEVGQVLALTAVLIALSIWRTRSGFFRYALATNTALMAAGFVLVGYQIAGFSTHG